MPRISDIPPSDRRPLAVPGVPFIGEALGGDLVQGGTYLLTGEPGIGKSTGAIQVLGDLAKQGHEVLYLTNEQTTSDLKAAVERLCSGRGGRLPHTIERNLSIDDRLVEPSDLVTFLNEEILRDGGQYHGTRAIVLDSIQGRGLSSSSQRGYRALYAFAERAKANCLTTILIGHVTKGGAIAGPKTLEHNVDAVLCLRRGFGMRPLFVPKNRFGRARFDPLILEMDARGRLRRSPRATALGTSVPGFAGWALDFAETQAAVSMPRYGASAALRSPDMPREKMRQVIRVVGDLAEVDLSDLTYDIDVYVPGRREYKRELDLPLAVSILASYLQLPVSPRAIFVGEVDLLRRVRRPWSGYVKQLRDLLRLKESRVSRLYISDQIDPEEEQELSRHVEVRKVSSLDDLVVELWPRLVAGAGAEN